MTFVSIWHLELNYFGKIKPDENNQTSSQYDKGDGLRNNQQKHMLHWLYQHQIPSDVLDTL